MKNAALDDFVKSQQSPPQPTVDWNKERSEWLRRLDELYDRIDKFLNSYIKSGQILVESHPIELSEEYSGRYTARQVTLKIGQQHVLFRPVGTLLIGSKGRVDVIGPRGTTVPILLIDSNGEKSVRHDPDSGRPGRQVARYS